MNSTQTLHLLLLLTLLIILCIGSGGIAATTIEAKEEAVATALRLRHVVKRASIKENLAAIDRVVQHLDNIVQQMGQTEGELHAAASSWQGEAYNVVHDASKTLQSCSATISQIGKKLTATKSSFQATENSNSNRFGGR